MMADDNSFTDDFERTGSGELGANWRQYDSISEPDWLGNADLSHDSFSLKLVDEEKVNPLPVLYWRDPDTDNYRKIPMAPECASCHRRWRQGDLAESQNGGPFAHRSCADPRGEAHVESPE